MEKTLLNNYFNFFDTHIKSLTEFFETDEIQNKINQFDPLIKIYMKSHYVKSHNLILSLFLLARGIDDYRLPDESRIIFRSLFEHILNFMYIFSEENEQKIIEQIKEYNEFIKIQQFKFVNKIVKKGKPEDTSSNFEKEMYEKAKDVYVDKNLEDLFSNHHKNTWHGCNIPSLIEKIAKKHDKELLLFEKYYTLGNLYTHCNIMDYINDEGVIDGNINIIKSLDVLHDGLTFYTGYIDCFYQCINIEVFKNLFIKYYEDFNSLEDRYFEIKKS